CSRLPLSFSAVIRISAVKSLLPLCVIICLIIASTSGTGGDAVAAGVAEEASSVCGYCFVQSVSSKQTRINTGGHVRINFVSSENQPRRNEEHEGFFCSLFVSFVSSWLIFILSGRRP